VPRAGNGLSQFHAAPNPGSEDLTQRRRDSQRVLLLCVPLHLGAFALVQIRISGSQARQGIARNPAGGPGGLEVEAAGEAEKGLQ